MGRDLNADLDETTLRTMGAMLRLPPKPHADMKLGKPRAKSRKAKPKAAKAPAR